MRKSAALLVLLAVLSIFPVAVKARQEHIFPATTEEPPTASAQQDTKLLLVYISVWPEYEYSAEKPDQLNVLVINRFVLDSHNIKYPVTVRLQIPESAIQPHVVAVGETPETVSDKDVQFTTSTPENGWIDVFVTTTGPAIQLEYYDYNIVKNGAAREYIYEWPGTYTTGTFHLDVRVPLQATNMRSDPDASTAGTDADGFKFGEMTVPDMTAGKTFTLKINYDRDTDRPSTSFMQVKPSAPLDQPVSGQFSLEPYFRWILAGLALIVVAAAATWYWLSTRSGGRSSGPRKRGGAAVRKKPEEDAKGDREIYCHECGKRAQSSDRFCRTCGAELRQSEA